MNNTKLKYILFILIFLFAFKSLSFSKINSKIVFKINDEIVTNIDLDNEKKFLLFLNPKLNNLSKKQIQKISRDSFTNRMIKETELKKYFDLNKKNVGKKYVERFISNIGHNNIETLKNKLGEFNLKYSIFEKNFLIDNLWKEYIFNRFKSKVKIDVNKLKKEIENQEKEIEELNLSEILFEIKPNLKFEELKKQIYSEIQKSGFEAAASIFSISNSKDFGGKLGWIKSSQISKNIYSKLQIGKEITDPIKTNNGYLIIKINERRKVNEKIQLDVELKKLVQIETDNELNKLGYIYFNKLKKKTFISEK